MESAVTFRPEFSIAGRSVGGAASCLIIAEAGVNHFGSIEKAFALVDLAVDAGADVLKLQHFKTDKLVGAQAPEWRERLRSKELSDDDILRVRDHCDRRGIIFLCTGHEPTALDFLDRKVGVPAFKIGSGEVGNWPWIQEIATRGKPIILSTGMYTLADIRSAISAVAAGGGSDLSILHCITSYPTEPHDVNLSVLGQIREFFPGPVGYSDHTTGTAVCLAAVAIGAKVIEKHITIDRNVPNAQDWKVSCDLSNFGKFVADIREIESAMGGGAKILAQAEKQAMLWARKSLAAAREIAVGETLMPEMLIAQRPGDGISPERMSEIVGRKVRVNIHSGAQISEDMLI